MSLSGVEFTLVVHLDLTNRPVKSVWRFANDLDNYVELSTILNDEIDSLSGCFFNKFYQLLDEDCYPHGQWRTNL